MHDIKSAYKRLSKIYREKGYVPQLTTPEETRAYTLARMPATFAVAKEVLQYLNGVESILDWGCGAGAASWAAVELFSELKRITLIDSSMAMLKVAQNIAQDLPQYQFNYAINQHHDLVIFSYSLSEISDLAVLDQAWANCNQYLVVIEPGTPTHFKNLLRAREKVINLGGRIIAPCPHSRQCPMEDTADWCHFSKRLERDVMHRFIKEATLPYEDEKYSYFVAVKPSVTLNTGNRIIKKPLRRSGHVILDVCTEKGIERVTVSKKNKYYKMICKMKWGQAINYK